MLTPPFTILIIKKAHRPITVRVTGWFMLIIVMLVAVALVAASFSIHRITPQPNGQSVEELLPGRSASAEYVLIADPVGKETDENNSQEKEPDITEFEVTQDENGDVAFTFTVENTPEGETLYLWIMVNPNTELQAESAIYPRSPLFRGLPVDYRNGIRHTPRNGHQLRLTFSGPDAGVILEQFRILAYETSGNLIIDKTLTVKQNIRM